MTRDRELGVAALTEVSDAHRAISGDAHSARAVRHLHAALRQAKETLYDLTERRAGITEPPPAGVVTVAEAGVTQRRRPGPRPKPGAA